MNTPLTAAIAHNRRKHKILNKYRKIRHAIILNMFEYQDVGLDDKAKRVADKCSKIIKKWLKGK